MKDKKNTKPKKEKVIQTYVEENTAKPDQAMTDEEAEKVIYGDIEQYSFFVGKLLFYLERSLLSLERKVFYQAACLSGYLSDQLIEDMLKEMNEAKAGFEGHVKELEQKVEAQNQNLDQMSKEYGEAAKKRRHALQKIREELLKRTEGRIEEVLHEEESVQIQKLQKKLKNNG